jgi:integrase
VRESAHSSKAAVARKLLNTRLGEVGSGRLVSPDAERVTFEDLEKGLLTDYSVRGRRSLQRDAAGELKGRLASALAHLRGTFGGRRAVDITSSSIREYEVARLTVAQRATVNYELALVRRMFALAVELGTLTRAHVPTIRTPDPKNARTGVFSEADYRNLLTLLPEELRPIIVTAKFTGWRVQDELLPLRWSQVNFQNGTLTLAPNTTKNDEGRTFIFDAFQELADVLREQRARTSALAALTGQDIPFVFHRQGHHILSIRRQWKKALKAAGLVGHVLHDFRRTAVVNLERAGVSRSVAKKLVGHKTDAMYNRYSIAAETDLREGAAKLAANLNRTITGQFQPD